MRVLLAIGLAALAVGGWALTASGDEPPAKPPAGPPAKPETKAVETAELPPLPEMRPKVVEPRAGESASAAPAAPMLCATIPMRAGRTSADRRRKASAPSTSRASPRSSFASVTSRRLWNVYRAFSASTV
jgi:hypothetical protein